MYWLSTCTSTGVSDIQYVIGDTEDWTRELVDAKDIEPLIKNGALKVLGLTFSHNSLTFVREFHKEYDILAEFRIANYLSAYLLDYDVNKDVYDIRKVGYSKFFGSYDAYIFSSLSADIIKFLLSEGIEIACIDLVDDKLVIDSNFTKLKAKAKMIYGIDTISTDGDKLYYIAVNAGVPIRLSDFGKRLTTFTVNKGVGASLDVPKGVSFVKYTKKYYILILDDRLNIYKSLNFISNLSIGDGLESYRFIIDCKDEEKRVHWYNLIPEDKIIEKYD